MNMKIVGYVLGHASTLQTTVCDTSPSEGHLPGMLQVRILLFLPDPQVFVQSEYSSHSSHWANTVANIKIEFFPSIDNFFNDLTIIPQC